MQTQSLSTTVSHRKDRQLVKELEERCSDRHDSLQGPVKKVERDIAVLRGQLQNNRQAVADLFVRLESTQEVAHSSIARLTDVEQVVDALWSLLKNVRDTLHDLSIRREMLAPMVSVTSGELINSIWFLPGTTFSLLDSRGRSSSTFS